VLPGHVEDTMMSPAGRMISLNTSSPYRNARGRIRRWLRTV
jgi:hypothetical protein